MADLEIVNQQPLSMVDVKEKLDTIQKEKKELNYRATKVLEHINSFEIMSKKELEEMKKELESLEISRLKERVIIKISEILPKESDSLKAVLIGENLTLKQDDMARIIEIVKKYA